MPDIFDLMMKWWKQILAVMILTLLAVGIITFMKPRQYLAVATAIPTSSYASDKSKIFNRNLQTLYSELGTPDDLDVILGTAQLDTVYLALTDQFNLFDHYKIKGNPEQMRTWAAAKLKKNTRVYKSGYGELKVKIWDTDKNLAPELANGMMQIIQAIQTDARNSGNKTILQALKDGKKKLLAGADSLSGTVAGSRDSQLLQYDQLINEYQLMTDSKSPALVIVENARRPESPDRPKRIQIMIAALVLSFLISVLVALVLERRKIKIV
jgi:uncharacterized protein involved in exopolysaccharide biosynthesis